jgi:hypothetical protein
MINDYEPEGFEVCVKEEEWGNELWIVFKEI